MNVKCNNCNAEYTLDVTKLKKQTSKFCCTKCKGIIDVIYPDFNESEPEKFQDSHQDNDLDRQISSGNDGMQDEKNEDNKNQKNTPENQPDNQLDNQLEKTDEKNKEKQADKGKKSNKANKENLPPKKNKNKIKAEKTSNPKDGLLIFVLLSYVVFILIWSILKNYNPDIVALSVLGAIFILMFQPNISNLFSGFWIKWNNTYRTGDWITIDGFEEGIITKMSLTSTSIKLRDNTIITVPNNKVINSTINKIGSNDKKYRLTLNIQVDPTILPERAKKVLLDAILPIQGILNDPEPKIIYNGIANKLSDYMIIFFVNDYNKKESFIETAWNEVWRILKRAKISFLPESPTAPESEMPMESEELDPSVILEEVKVFESLSEYAKSYLGQHMRSRKFGVGEFIVNQGDKADSLFIIEEGVVGIKVHIQGEEDLEVARLGACSFFGEMALMTGEPRSASIYAVTESHLFEIIKDDIAPLIQEQPDVLKPLIEEQLKRKLSTEAQKSEHQISDFDEDAYRKNLNEQIQKFFNL